MENLIGVDVHGIPISENNLLKHDCEIAFIAEGKQIPGKEICLSLKQELVSLPYVKLSPSKRRFNAVIKYLDNGRLVRGAIISQVGLLDSITIPEVAKNCLKKWSWNPEEEEYLTLENSGENKIYVRKTDVIPLSRISRYILG
jgi:hypothetical protein